MSLSCSKLDFLNDLQENEIFDYFISAGIDDVKPGNIEDKLNKLIYGKIQPNKAQITIQ